MTLTGTVLLVDDDSTVVLGYAKLLARHSGLQILTAGSADAGLDAARIHRPDLILSDLRMEGVDGFEFCRQVRREPTLEAHQPDAPAVVPMDEVCAIVVQVDAYPVADHSSRGCFRL